MNRVYKVYKDLQEAGRDILLPAPPLANHGEIPGDFNHGVIDKPDPHKVEDRVRLLAQIEMDAQLSELRQKQIDEQKQRVLAKPNMNNNEILKESSEKIEPLDNNAQETNENDPLVFGGADSDTETKERRETVKAVRNQN